MTLLRLVCLAAVSSLALACSSAPDPAPDGRASPTTPGPTASSPDPARAQPGSANGTGGARPPAPATTAAGGFVVPRAGTYVYDVIEEGRDAAGPTRAEYEQRAQIDRPVQRDDDAVSVEIRTTNERTEEVTGEVYVYRRARIGLLFADGCVLEAEALHYRLPLRVGDAWASPRRCEGESDGGRSRVLRRETVIVGGVAVRAFVVERTGTFGQPQARKTQWYSPEHHLVVRSRLADTMNGAPHSVVQTLRSLSPA